MTSPFHTGERTVQQRMGVRADAERVGRMIADEVSLPLAKALSRMKMAVAATRDAEGRVWASLLTGPAGFLASVDETLLQVSGGFAPGDVLPRNVAAHPDLGLLGIDLQHRIRVRVNGRALLDPAHGLFVSVREAYANCPQYITPRSAIPDAAGMTATDRSPAPGPDALALIAAADTFFIGSAHADAGADASHRGGSPGFVTVEDERTLSFPDHPGNTMFNTLGNLALDPRAGLLFLDFEGQAALQLTGRATVDWSGPRPRVTYRIDECLSHHPAARHQKGMTREVR
jgi:predicted pyridoxine 5'-phosphate oxidase superfamily flavin-nucleotide-binding protein